MSDTAVHQELALAAEFPATDRADWLRLVEKALKDRPFETLVSRTYDAIPVEPLYTRAAGVAAVAGRELGRPWTVMQRVDHPDPKAANAQALDDLESGATGLTLVFAGSLNANGYGLSARPEALAQVLDGIALDAVTIDFNLSFPTRHAVQLFAELVKQRKLPPPAVDLRASINPIGGLAASGASPAPWSELSKRVAGAIRDLAAEGYRGPFAVADGRIIHNAGGSEAQELAFALAAAVDCLRALDAGGVPLEQARGMIYFRLAADAEQFLTIAKFRAIRKLWARIEQACGLAPRRTIVAAETAWRMLSRRDPYVNMLRTTIAVTAAGVGGADNIVALPHTAAIGLPDAFARRVARNTQLVLLEESNLAKVSDPAAGSGAIEHLTEALCGTAWELFQAYDKAGGAWAALEQGLIQRDVAKVREQRQRAAALRKDPITGTSDYPDLHEETARVLDLPRVPLPQQEGGKPSVELLPSIRLAEPFEALRDRSDAILKQTGARPKVFLASLGRLSDFNARATFAKNFYEAGGLETIGNDGFLLTSPLPSGERSTAKRSGEGERSSRQRSNLSPAPSPSAPERPLPMGEVKTDIAALTTAFEHSGARIACLCSADKVYATEAADAAKALAAAGAVVHLAGRPGEHEAAWNAAGVKTYIYAGCDVLATLTAAYDMVSKP